MTRLPALLLFAGLLTACITTDVTRLSGAPSDLAPVPAAEVATYADTSSVPCPYQKLAIVNVDGGNVATPRDRIVQRAKEEEAGPMGANAIIIQGFGTNDGRPTGQFLAILEDRPCGASAEK